MVHDYFIQLILILRDIEEFDARPFIRTFDFVQHKLLDLRKIALEKIEDLDGEMSKLEMKHADRLKILFEAFRVPLRVFCSIATVLMLYIFKESHSAFELLESRISDVGHTAIKIGHIHSFERTQHQKLNTYSGEQLETIDEQKQKAEAVKVIIRYFLDLNGEKFTSELDILFNSTDLEDQRKVRFTYSVCFRDIQIKVKAGQILRRLSSVGKEMQHPETLTVSILMPHVMNMLLNLEKAKKNIEKYCEQFENNILRFFDNAYKDKDIELMAVSWSEESMMQPFYKLNPRSVPKFWLNSMEEILVYRHISISTNSLIIA
jgi:hypothetical protein